MPMFQSPVSGGGIQPDVADLAALLAVASPAAGDCRRTVAPVITGGTPYVRWVFDGGLWRLDGCQDLYVDTTPVDGVASASEQLIRSLTIPAGLLLLLRWTRLWALVAKSGATDAMTLFRARLGTTGSASDATISSVPNLMTAAFRANTFDHIGFAASSTVWRNTAFPGAPGWGNGTGVGGSGAYPVNVTISDASVEQTLTLRVQMAGTTDTPSIPHVIISAG